MNHVTFAVTAILWIAHCLLLVFINITVAKRGVEAKYVATIYIFYALTLLVPFYNHEHFNYVVNYTPSIGSLFIGICADFSVILAIHWSFPKGAPTRSINRSAWKQLGFAMLVTVAAVAQVTDIIVNRELLLLPKELFIDAEKVPNLILFSIPAQLILLGGALYSPFKSRLARWVIAALGTLAIALSVIQGYRGLAFMVALYVIFRKWPRVWPAVPAVLITVAGELSNPIKYFVGGFFLNEHFDAAATLNYYAGTADTLFGLSGEQKAILSNLVIGMRDLAVGQPIFELRNLFPFTNQLFGNISVTSASRLGELTGAGIGQGTGYGYFLFLAESMLIAPLMLLIITRTMRTLHGTPLTFLSWSVFFSLMRDTPAFWTGELKMLILLVAAVIFSAYFMRRVFRPPRNALPAARSTAFSSPGPTSTAPSIR